MTCDDAELLLAANAVGGLDESDEPGLRVHLRDCADCRRTGGVLLAVGTMIAEVVPAVTPPPGLRRSLMAKVEAEARAHSTVAVQSPSPRTSLLQRLGRVPTGISLALGGGVALAVASVAVVLTAAAPHPAPSVAVHAAACQAVGVPTIDCTLDYDPRLRQAVLSVDHLVPPAVLGGGQAQTYEVWLIARGGVPLPVAFLSQHPDGGGWSAAIDADLRNGTAVAVTAEPPGGSPAPTGREIVRVTLPAGI
ncbi:MAG TPA: anti-sigma factor [Candidatus Dormibacteraeota bacterium]|nr:anti-sigma factor [Candidatus Dormibacteraeota bacterium]